MKAWQIGSLGAAPILSEIPALPPAMGEVQVRVAACGLNFADLLMRDGKYQERAPFPYTPGLEVAGTVIALGPDSAGPAPGTRVLVGRCERSRRRDEFAPAWAPRRD